MTSDFTQRRQAALDDARIRGFIHGSTWVTNADVGNPAPDRRHKDDWRKHVVIPAGTRFRLVMTTVESSTGKGVHYLPQLQLARGAYAGNYRLRPWLEEELPLWERLVPALVVSPRTFQDVLWRADDSAGHLSAGEILEALVEQGIEKSGGVVFKLTFEDLDRLIDKLVAQTRERPSKED